MWESLKLKGKRVTNKLYVLIKKAFNFCWVKKFERLSSQHVFCFIAAVNSTCNDIFFPYKNQFYMKDEAIDQSITSLCYTSTLVNVRIEDEPIPANWCSWLLTNLFMTITLSIRVLSSNCNTFLNSELEWLRMII